MGRSIVLKILVGACMCLSACGPRFDVGPVVGSGLVGEPVLYGVDYSDDVMWERYLGEEGSYKMPESVIGVVLPHHLITALELTRFYRGLSEVIDPRLVVIVSPNHYEAGEVDVQTCSCSYSTDGGGVLRTSEGDLGRLLESELVASGLVALKNENFEIEHGIYAHANFVARFFPEAEILPLILKEDMSFEDVDLLVEYFEGEFGGAGGEGGGGSGGSSGSGGFGEDVLFIASVDFAHYMTAEISDKHDDVSFEAISVFDYGQYPDLELDSPGSIYFLSRLAERNGFGRVDLIEHTNSQDYFQKFLEETTSHLYITFSKGE